MVIDHLRGRERVLVGEIAPTGTSTIDLVAAGAVSTTRPNDHVHNQAYLTWLNAHRASVSFPGAGFDTARFWEILASGALLLSKRISLDLPVPLIDGVHYVGFDSLDELDQAVEFALSDSSEVDAIRANRYAVAIGQYSTAAMARRLLNALAE